MPYSIKELNQQWISKTLVYEALKNGLPFSKDFIKNKRVFNENDLELFRFYKTNGLEKTLSRYGAVSTTNPSQPTAGATAELARSQASQEKTVFKPFSVTAQNNWHPTDQSDSVWNEDFQKSLLTELETVKKLFADKENSLKVELEQKDKIISIREEQTQKYALLKVEEQHEKEAWIQKYEVINQEKTDWIRRFYALKTYLIVSVVLFLLSVTALAVTLTLQK